MRAYLLGWQYTPIAYILSLRQIVCRQPMVREEVFHEVRDARKDHVEVGLKMGCLSPSAKPD